MIHNVSRFFLASLLLLAVAACSKHYKPGELAPNIDAGKTYYTQFSLFQEKNEFRTTNYRRGLLIPINTAATLVAIDKKRIEVRLNKTGQPLTVENVQKHTNEDSQQAFKKIFGTQPVDLSRFPPGERENILNGEVKRGMSRSAVLAAIGYPPASSTPSLKADEWMYWASRYDRFIVRFRDERVVEIVN